MLFAAMMVAGSLAFFFLATGPTKLAHDGISPNVAVEYPHQQLHPHKKHPQTKPLHHFTEPATLATVPTRTTDVSQPVVTVPTHHAAHGPQNGSHGVSGHMWTHSPAGSEHKPSKPVRHESEAGETPEIPSPPVSESSASAHAESSSTPAVEAGNASEPAHEAHPVTAAVEHVAEKAVPIVTATTGGASEAVGNLLHGTP